MQLNQTGTHILARYLGLQQASDHFDGIHVAFAILVEYSPYINETIPNNGFRDDIVNSILAVASPTEVAILLSSGFGLHLSHACFQHTFIHVFVSTDEMFSMWKLGQAAYHRRLKFGKTFVAPTKLATQLLSSVDPEYRVIGLKVLAGSDTPLEERLRIECGYLSSAEEADVSTALFVLDGEMEDKAAILASSREVRESVKVALQSLSKSTHDSYIRQTAERLQQRL